jgi:hypothetical protein
MNLRPIVAKGALAITLIGTGFVIAQAPRPDIDPHKHPNLAEAQRLLDQAYHKTVDAQKANEFDMSGHAQKAKDLMDQASRELKQAAEVASHR